MTDWSARHRPRLEPIGWLAAATLAALLAVSTAALANWLGLRVGTGTSESTILLDLPPLPPTLAVSEPPTPQPAAPPQPRDMQTAPDADETAPPAPRPEEAPDLTPPDRQAMQDMAEALPAADTPPAQPEKPAKPAAKQKPDKAAKKPAKQAEPAAPASAAIAAATARGDGATASAMRKWAAKASQRLDRHMRRGSYDARGQVTIRFQVAASGQITGAKLIGSSGNASLDAALLAQARRAPALPERPDGKSGQIDKSVTFAP